MITVAELHDNTGRLLHQWNYVPGREEVRQAVHDHQKEMGVVKSFIRQGLKDIATEIDSNPTDLLRIRRKAQDIIQWVEVALRTGKYSHERRD